METERLTMTVPEAAEVLVAEVLVVAVDMVVVECRVWG